MPPIFAGVGIGAGAVVQYAKGCKVLAGNDGRFDRPWFLINGGVYLVYLWVEDLLLDQVKSATMP